VKHLLVDIFKCASLLINRGLGMINNFRDNPIMDEYPIEEFDPKVKYRCGNMVNGFTCNKKARCFYIRHGAKWMLSRCRKHPIDSELARLYVKLTTDEVTVLRIMNS
jgi:hypothetical protein